MYSYEYYEGRNDGIRIVDIAIILMTQFSASLIIILLRINDKYTQAAHTQTTMIINVLL